MTTPKTPKPRGGARPGAGRKRKAEANRTPVKAAEQRLADRLPATVANLEALADGMTERVEVKQLPAGLVVASLPLRDGQGNPMFDARGKPLMADQLVYPDKPAAELVTVEQKTVRVGPDFRANQYLADRVMGKPTERVEADLTSGGEMFKTVLFLPDNGRDHAGDDDAGTGDPAATGPTNDVPGDPG